MGTFSQPCSWSLVDFDLLQYTAMHVTFIVAQSSSWTRIKMSYVNKDNQYDNIYYITH